ncbi:uncharacterized protein FOMMEDRAFT_169462 [Fomitiporia mediterranea MF3/22]|uniref:uncharacterized protein n=1 Tax=Fomitiporia mediterranea (strain MF3/22) TaxID=694068 RepID=UPI0004408BB7|nr:uncharacterized protein FOMMEDRAFT_169462 [Fomitiporia mediterranea MF3/22]EJD01318.1 hypothetical protein FOMMEDRAFT_169462 [Fomitiporia mediterranea MF3/22]
MMTIPSGLLLACLLPGATASLAANLSNILGQPPLSRNPSAFMLKHNIVGNDFFKEFEWDASDDPTHGRVNYVDKATAIKRKLASATANSFIMKVDDTNIVPKNTRGRDSNRIRSYESYTDSVHVLDVKHVPWGCGTWPAFWTVAEKDWPHGGEIDIIEGVNKEPVNQATLHTSPGCQMPQNRPQTGNTVSTDCNAFDNGNQGCATSFQKSSSYGPGLNNNGGGYFIMKRTQEDGVSVWHFGRNDPNTPPEVKAGEYINPGSHWGTPDARFPSTDKCNFASHFTAHKTIFDTTLCGDWAGNVFSSTCGKGSCEDFVDKNPKAFEHLTTLDAGFTLTGTHTKMIPLIPALALSILSLLCSAFSIFRILVPLIPYNRIHPTRKIRKTLSLSHADKAHLWLSGLDIISLLVFVWEVFNQNLAQTTNRSVGTDTAASARLFLVLTLRQIFLLGISAVSLIQVRRSLQSSFGIFHWRVWVPPSTVTAISTAITGIYASKGIQSFRIGVTAYIIFLAISTTAAIIFLVVSLRVIQDKLMSNSEWYDSWYDAITDVKSSYSFPTEDVEALKDGSSWITSDAGSRRDSISSFSFESTARSAETSHDVNNQQQVGESSQQDSSWLTEPSVPPRTITDWSFSTNPEVNMAHASTTMDNHTQLGVNRASCPLTPALSSTQFIGHSDLHHRGVGDRNDSFQTFNKMYTKDDRARWIRMAGWLAYIWLPLSLALPFMVSTSLHGPTPVLFIISMTVSAPLLAFNVLISPLPITTSLMEDVSNLPKLSQLEGGYKRSASITIVEGRRSGDVWLSKGDAFDGKNRLSRGISLLSKAPKLAVLPAKASNFEVDNYCNINKSSTAEYPVWGNSVATSAFVAIDPYRGDEVGQLYGPHATNDRNDFLVRSGNSMRSFSGTNSMPVSRSSSISSGSSKGDRIRKFPFTTNLETILDTSLNTPQRAVRTDNEGGIFFPRSEMPSHPHILALQGAGTASDQTQEGLIASVRLCDQQDSPNESDSLSAGLLPLLVPGLKIGSASEAYKTPENKRERPSTLLPFPSPEDMSTPKPQRLWMDGVDVPEQTEDVFGGTDNCKVQRSRIPRWSQGLQRPTSSIAPIGEMVNQGRTGYALHTAIDDGQTRPYRPSMIPVPVRLQGADVEYTIERAPYASRYRGNSLVSEGQNLPLSRLPRLARSASDKRAPVVRHQPV